MFDNCVETVSILYAVIFGAGDACIMISTWSILSALGVFLVLVILAQFVARKLWARVSRSNKPRPQQSAAPYRTGTIHDDPNYKDSAIRSSKR